MRIIIAILITFASAFQLHAEEIYVFAGAGLIKPMEEIKAEYAKTHKIIINIHYAGAGELFGMLAMGKKCDILIPGAAKHTYDAVKNGWIVKSTIKDVVYHVPVIAVQDGNPKNIRNLSDLARADVKVALGDPKGPAIGRVAKQMLEEAKLYDKIKPRTQVWTPTVNQLFIYINMKQVDAVIIWEDLAAWPENKRNVEIVKIPAKQNKIKTIPTALTPEGNKNKEVREFNNYILSEKGKSVWKKWGFTLCRE